MKKDFISKINNLALQIKSFELLGIDLCPDDGSSTIFKHPKIFACFTASTLLAVASKLWYAINYFDGIEKFTSNLVFCMAGSLGIIFILLFLIRKNKFSKLISDFKALAKKVSSSERNEIALQSRQEKLFVLIQYIIFWGTILTLYIPPLLSGIICLFKGQNVGAQLPTSGSYPYDNEKPAYFLISWLLNSGMIFLSVSLVVGLNGLFSWYIHHLMAYFNILCSRFVTLGKCLKMETFDNKSEETISQQLNELFSYHSKLIVLVKQLDMLFAPILFAIVLFSAIELCLVIFQLQVAENAADMIIMIFSTLGVLLQTMIFCFGGQKIKNHSDKLCQEIYLSIPWHVLKKPMARLLLIAMNRAQAGNHLTGYFFIADCNLFLMILKSASSLGALFRAIKDAE